MIAHLVLRREAFPFGWKRVGPAVGGHHFLDTTGVWHNGRWWMYTSVRTGTPWCWLLGSQRKSYSLRLYTARSLLGKWSPHPDSPVSEGSKYSRSGGRPFVLDGRLHRWAKDSSLFFGWKLHLFRATTLTDKVRTAGAEAIQADTAVHAHASSLGTHPPHVCPVFPPTHTNQPTNHTHTHK